MTSIASLTAAALIAIASPATPASARDEAAPPPGFVALFNGKDLAGWHGRKDMDPRQYATLSGEALDQRRAADDADAKMHWKAQDGDLINDGHGVFLSSDRDYGDIELMIDYRTVAKADSGIYLRATPQVQIWDFTEAGGKWKLGAEKGSGGLWNNSPGAPGKDPLVFADRPLGEWNRLAIVQVGARTTVHLNGKLVVDFAAMENFWDRTRPLFPRGPILLQTHGGEIRWKKMYLREIPADEANSYLAEHGEPGLKPVFDGKTLAGWAGSTENFEVVDGAIRCKPGKGGCLFTEAEYADFDARVEFKVPSGGNNGLAIRYPGTGDPAYTGMCELQVLDDGDGRYAKIDPRQAHGSAYGMIPAKRGYLRPAGEWNFQEVTVRGSTIRVELNGTVILDGDLAKVKDYMADSKHPGVALPSGHFGFAGHNDPVQFRRVSIKPLPASVP